MQNLSSKAERVQTGRRLSVKVAGNVDAVRDSVGRSPKKSIRRRSQECLRRKGGHLEHILKRRENLDHMD